MLKGLLLKVKCYLMVNIICANDDYLMWGNITNLFSYKSKKKVLYMCMYVYHLVSFLNIFVGFNGI